MRPWVPVGLALGAITVGGLGMRASRAQVPPLPVLTTTTTAPATPTTHSTAPATSAPAPSPPPSTVTGLPATTSTTEPTTTTTTTLAEPLPSPPLTTVSAAVGPAATAPTSLVLPSTSGADVIAPSTVSGAFGMGVAASIGLALVLISLAALGRVHVFSDLGGPAMLNRARNRLSLGFACIAAAAIVAVVGYLGLSRNPDVNRQIPYLASAGMAVVILAAVGGAFIVAEQLRNDDERIADLEEAVRQLADAVSPVIEAPPRTRARRPARQATRSPDTGS